MSKLPQVVLDPPLVQTNIVIFSLRGEGDAEALVSALARRGVLAGTVGPNSVRLVTHHDVDRAACERAGADSCRGDTQDGVLYEKTQIPSKDRFLRIYTI